MDSKNSDIVISLINCLLLRLQMYDIIATSLEVVHQLDFYDDGISVSISYNGLIARFYCGIGVQGNFTRRNNRVWTRQKTMKREKDTQSHYTVMESLVPWNEIERYFTHQFIRGRCSVIKWQRIALFSPVPKKNAKWDEAEDMINLQVVFLFISLTLLIVRVAPANHPPKCYLRLEEALDEMLYKSQARSQSRSFIDLSTYTITQPLNYQYPLQFDSRERQNPDRRLSNALNSLQPTSVDVSNVKFRIPKNVKWVNCVISF